MPDEPDNPGSFGRVLCHLLAELSWKMVCALGIIAFFFFYGAANAAVKLTGRTIASFDTPPGPIAGLGGAGLVVILVCAAKLRPRD